VHKKDVENLLTKNILVMDDKHAFEKRMEIIFSDNPSGLLGNAV
jgi:hypothetical protein